MFRSAFLGIVLVMALAVLAPSRAAAQQAVLGERDYAVCGNADSPWADAAKKNAELLDTLEWSPFGVPEKGWEVYGPLLAREIGTGCGYGTPKFAEAVAAFQAQYKLEPDGVFGPDTFVILKGLLQERRPFILARLRGECPVAPVTYIMTNLPKKEDTYDREDRRLRGDALAAYRKMVEAARRDGIIVGGSKVLTIFSGYRQADADGERCAIEGNCDGKRRAACSPHATGYAVDLNLGYAPGYRVDSTHPVNRLWQTRTPAYRWLVRNAYRFGFVNYVFEPWHWEWVGEKPLTPDVAATEAAFTGK